MNQDKKDQLQEPEYMQRLKDLDPETYRIFSNLNRLIISYNKKPHHVALEEPPADPIPKQHKRIDKSKPKDTAAKIQEAILNYNLHSNPSDHIVFIKIHNETRLGRIIINSQTHEIEKYSILSVEEMTNVLNVSAVWKEIKTTEKCDYSATWKISRSRETERPEPDKAPLWLIYTALNIRPNTAPNLSIYDIHTGTKIIKRTPAGPTRIKK